MWMVKCKLNAGCLSPKTLELAPQLKLILLHRLVGTSLLILPQNQASSETKKGHMQISIRQKKAYTPYQQHVYKPAHHHPSKTWKNHHTT